MESSLNFLFSPSINIPNVSEVQWDWFLQEPDLQKNEYMNDDLDLEVDIGSRKYLLLLFFVTEVFVSHGAIIYIVTQCLGTHLTKTSSRGKFSLLAHCYNLLSPKLFFFLWPLIDAFGEERQVTWKDCLRRPKMYIVVSKTKTEARSTQISKTKHPKLENGAPKFRKRSTYRKRSTRKRSNQNSKPL